MKLDADRLAERIYNKRMEWCVNNGVAFSAPLPEILAAECHAIASSIAEEIEEVTKLSFDFDLVLKEVPNMSVTREPMDLTFVPDSTTIPGPDKK